MILNIAMVEDEEKTANLIRDCLAKYQSEKGGVEFNAVWFSNPIDFLSKYNHNFDVVFMDIELPDMDGFITAKKLRLIDAQVPLVFITNMSQYAVKGYEVNAFDYIVKPVIYFKFALKLDRLLKHLNSQKLASIHVNIDGGIMVLAQSEIKYLEVIKHTVIFHTIKGNYTSYGTLKSKEEQLDQSSFEKCNNCYLVNLRFVDGIKGNVVIVDGEELQMSRPKRKSFINALTNYLGENS